jgi:hypothetical protein
MVQPPSPCVCLIYGYLVDIGGYCISKTLHWNIVHLKIAPNDGLGHYHVDNKDIHAQS